MKSRKTSSTRWTRFPTHLEKDLKQAFCDIFSGLLKGYDWFVEGHFFPEETVLSIGFGHPKRLKHHHFHLSWQFSPGELESLNPKLSVESPKPAAEPSESGGPSLPLQEIYLAADELQKIILGFVEKTDTDLPRHWQALSHPQLRELYFCYSTENLALERWADELLSETQDPQGLTGGQWEEES